MEMKGNIRQQGDDDDGSEVPDRESKRGYSLAGVDGDAMLPRELQKILASFEALAKRVGVLGEKLESFHHSSSSVDGDPMRQRELETKLEAMVKRVEVLEEKLGSFHHSSSRSSFDQFDPSQRRGCQLHFDGKLPATMYTGNEIESEDSKPVKILLFDASNKIISTGPLSSMNVEIVPLDGDFGANDQGDWTEQEFNAKTVRPREGKREVLTGKTLIRLRNGVGYIDKVSFTDNSSWTRTGVFILGARADPSKSNQVSVREARSEPITVKDHRVEYNKKHHPPELGDEIWRLENISRNGVYRKKLCENGITTIQHFLRSYYMDPSSLRKLLGRFSDKRWKTITEHATACVPDGKFYRYRREGQTLIFNSVFEVVAGIIGGQIYRSRDELYAGQKDLVQQMVRRTYKNMDDFVEHDGPLTNLLADSLANPSASLQHSNLEGQNQNMHQFHQLPLDGLESSQQEKEARRETQPQNIPVPHSVEGEISLAQQSKRARVDEEGTNANPSASLQHSNFAGQKQGTHPFLPLTLDRPESSQQMMRHAYKNINDNVRPDSLPLIQPVDSFANPSASLQHSNFAGLNQGTHPFLPLTLDRSESSQQMMRHAYKNMNDNLQPDSLPLIQQVDSFANPSATLQHSNFAGQNQDMHQFHQLSLDRLESSQQEKEARRETQPQNILVPHSAEREISLAQQSKQARVDEGTSTTGMAAEPDCDDFFNYLTFGGTSITGNAKEATFGDFFNSCPFDCTSDTGTAAELTLIRPATELTLSGTATELSVEEYLNWSTVHCTSANGMNGMDTELTLTELATELNLSGTATELTLASTNAKGKVGDTTPGGEGES